MATKNISRTVIEGGRRKGNKEERWQSNSYYRTDNRHFVHTLKSLVDADEGGTPPARVFVYKEFSDKLGALYRWLHSKVGQNWNSVYSQIRAKFDVRTTAGRHIVFDHLLNSVAVTDDISRTRSFQHNDFFVDAKGILQVTKGKHWKTRARQEYNAFRSQTRNWVQDRWVGYYGQSLFWMTTKQTEWKECPTLTGGNPYSWYPYRRGDCLRTHRDGTKLVLVDHPHKLLAIEKEAMQRAGQYSVTEEGYLYYRKVATKECKESSGPYKQGPKFTANDLAIWNVLSMGQKYSLLVTGSLPKV